MKANLAFEMEQRNENNLYDIYFYQEGLFWTAYEWSAYLAVFFPLNKGERLKPNRKFTKLNRDGFITVGLPFSSFDKYFPEILENEGICQIDENFMVIHAKSLFKNEDFTNYEEILNEWKRSVEPSDFEKEKFVKSKFIKHDRDGDYSSIINELRTYDIDNKTINESYRFLCYLIERANRIG